MSELYLLLGSIISIIFGFYYFLWRRSSYRLQSSFGFWSVHAGIILTDSPWILRHIFKKYLWLYWEYSIFRELERIPWISKIYTNLYLPQGETVTDTEVDLIFVHETWIYVIESKDYRGWIFGNENDVHWTQSFSRRGRFQFYNPIRQNYSHIKSLEKLIPEYKSHIRWIVVFSNRSSLKKIYFSNSTVIQTQEIRKRISGNKILTEVQIGSINDILVKYLSHSKQQELLHSKEVWILENPPLS